jgi:tetratricopeptide (TPR) repeat protein
MKTALLFVALCLSAGPAFAQDEILASYLQGGRTALIQGEYSKAESLFRSAISEIDRSSLDQESQVSAMIVSLNGLSAALTNQQKYGDAESVTRKQIALMELTKQADNPDYFVALNNLGLIQTYRKQYAEAIETHRKALVLREKHLEPYDPDIGISLLNLGKIYFELNKYDEAEAFLLRAVSILMKTPPERQTDEGMIALATCDMNLSSIKANQKKFKEAEEYILLSITLRTGIQGPNHPDLIEPLKNYAIILRSTGRLFDATKVEARIRQIASTR